MAKTDRALVITADGQHRVFHLPTALRRLITSKAGTAAQAHGTANRFTSSTGRKAALKRWKRHPMTHRGYRKGARFVRRAPVPRAPLREKYALQPVRGIQYSPAMKAWFISDEHGTRAISELTALRKLGHLPRANDRTVPISVERIK